MEIQFEKTAEPYLQTLICQHLTQELTQQVRLSDTMPDVEKVLASWGQVLLRGKEWRGSNIGVSGGVKTWVLYKSEGTTQPQCVESWLPFQMKWDIPETQKDGAMVACPGVPSVDVRMLSDRKLMVRASVGIHACAMVPTDTLLSLPRDVPEDVQVLKNVYPMLLPTEAGEKPFEMEESITLPSGEQPMDTLLRYTLQPRLIECKLVADKLVLRGVAHLQLLYIGTDGRILSWGMDLPFSQYTQLDNPYDDAAHVEVCFAVTALEMDKSDEGVLTLRAGIVAQYTIYQRKTITVVEDMYSPNRNIKLVRSQLLLPAVLDIQNQAFRAEITSENMPGGIVDAVFIADAPRLNLEDERVCVDLSGVFQLLGTDSEGNLHSESGRWEDNWTIPAAYETEVNARIAAMELPQTAGSSIRTELQLQANAVSQQPIDVVTGAEIGEFNEADPNRPSLILRRFGEESLWELAKQTGSTVEAIQKLNGLHQEPEENQMLMIPVM